MCHQKSRSVSGAHVRIQLLGTVAAVVLAASGCGPGGEVGQSGEALAGSVQILVFGDYPSARAPLASELGRLGQVTSVDLLPQDLSPYQTIWHVGAFRPLSSSEQARLADFIAQGGGLHLTGERPCCEALNASLTTFVNSVVVGGGIQVGGQGDINSANGNYGYPYPVNPLAPGNAAVDPHVIHDLYLAASGGMAGVPPANTLATGYRQVPVGGIWDRHQLVGGQGRLTLMMDVNWFEPSYRGPENIKAYENIQVYLQGQRNQPPVANAGGPYSTPEGSSVSLDGSASSDPDGEPLTYAWDLDNDGSYDDATSPSPSFFGADGPATHTVSLRVCDAQASCATASTTVAVHNVAPTAGAGADQTVFRHAAVSLAGTWSDPAGSADNSYEWSWDLDGDGSADASGPAAFGSSIAQSTSFAAAGTYVLTFQVADKDGASGSDTVTITVLNRPPDCSAAVPSASLLWPPNHQMEPIAILGVTDPDNDAVAVTISSIRQDEPVNDIADGNAAPDGAGVGTSTASVRAERAGSPRLPGNGRVYHLGFTATDGRDSCSGSVTVGVPHDQGGRSTPIDDGPLHDSTAP